MGAPRRARVTAAYATVKIMDPLSGKPTVAGFYQGAILPDDADPENVDSLVRREYAEWLDADENKAVEKAASDQEKATAAAARARAEETEARMKKAEAERAAAEKAAVKPAKADVVKPAEGQAPAVTASKSDWVAYAVSKRGEGMSEDEARLNAEVKSKNDLVAEFGG